MGAGGLEPVPLAAYSGEPGYGMGASAADYDNDGFVDLYVTNFGANRLLRNNGDGTFSAVAGADDDLWGVSSAWADYDLDGDLDLYVVNYVDFAWDNNKFCGDASRQISAYCHPDVYDALPDRLYENLGDGTFREVGSAAGIVDLVDGKGLGIVWGDYDDDGDPDAYIANDGTRNFLFTNQGDGTFVDDSFLAGVGYSEDGRAESGMGTDFGDFDGDGRLDLIVTNLTLETNTLYRNLGAGAFADRSFASGVGRPSLLYVGFGTNWFDADNDRDLDLFVANGHIIDNIADFRDNITYAQRNQVFENRDAVFTDVGPVPGLDVATVSRGSVVADFDRDGRLDVAVSNNGGVAELLRNESAAGNSITLHLRGRESARWPAGARIMARVGDSEVLVRELTAGSSYCSSGPARVHVGLADAPGAELTVRWPDGSVEELGTVAAGADVLVVQNRGIVARR